MKKQTLKTRIAISFLAVIGIVAVFNALLAYRVIRKDIVGKAQQQVEKDLRAARSIYSSEISEIGKAFNLVDHIDNIGSLKKRLELDYLYIVEKPDNCESELVHEAFRGNACGGTRIIAEKELAHMGNDVVKKVVIPVVSTPQARDTKKEAVKNAMAMEYAMPFFDSNLKVIKVLYGGKIVNRYFDLVDRIHDIIFESRLYNSKPVGTVTIFQDDVRIATNVLDKNGNRALGTQISAQVYSSVMELGKTWLDRAFVVSDWYITAYEPIRDIHGNVIGILYVGILEEPFNDMKRDVLIVFISIIAFGGILGMVLTYLTAVGVSKSLNDMLRGIAKISGGEHDYRLIERNIREFNELAQAFNTMTEELDARETSLKISNEKLMKLNKNYLDLVGMVSHEFKGILSSAVLNAYSLRDGYLGELSKPQQKAMNSIVKGLDYLTITVRNFLDLSRIEKDEMNLDLHSIRLREDVVDFSFDNFYRQAQEKNITIENRCAENIRINGDVTLLQIAMNNMLSNAVKYGADDGKIIIETTEEESLVSIDIYNDGRPLSDDDIQRLFKKFSRVNDAPEVKKVRGSGLGLFLTREIVEKHEGTITVVPRENGNSFIIKLKKEM